VAAPDKILIVDDEPDALENFLRILSGHRYDCLVETDASQALAATEREHPKVLLTDFRMPGLDGISLLKAAKRIDPAIQVVLLTAYASIQTAWPRCAMARLITSLNPLPVRNSGQ
jgi:DNA-binding NtrC family response regulator